MGDFFTIKALDWLRFGYAYSNSMKMELSKSLGAIHEVFIKLDLINNNETKEPPVEDFNEENL